LNKTGKSEAYDEIVRLGEQIVQALDLPEERSAAEPDLLSRWIAHEIAGAMKEVDRARSAAARQRAVRHATDLILSLWEHRAVWPSGWPPEPARARIEQLDYRRADDPVEKTGSPWIDGFLDLFALWVDEGRLWWKLGLLEQGVEEERAALETLPQTDDEGVDLDLLKRNVQLHDTARAWLEENNADSQAKTKALVETTFKRIAAERRRLQKTALAMMKSPKLSARRNTEKRQAKAR
jgi:hypothetical protein